MTDTLFDAHTGRDPAAVRRAEMVDAYVAELLAAPPVPYVAEPAGARKIAPRDVDRLIRAFRRAYGIDLCALVDRALAYRDAYAAQEGAFKGGLPCDAPRAAMYGALAELLLTLGGDL